MLKLAIDVGGTHTDAVLLDLDSETGEIKILAHDKIPSSTAGVTDSVLTIVERVLQKAQDSGHKISLDKINLHLGTTHFVNALKQRDGLDKVAIVRLALPASDLVPPFFSWPQGDASLLYSIYGLSAILHGGCEKKDGRVISKLSRRELEHLANRIGSSDIKHIVLSAPFSPIRPEMEKLAKKILQELLPAGISISLSQSFSGGILQRENAAALNAALLGKAKIVFQELTEQLDNLGLTAPILVTRNDGSFMSVNEAVRMPLLAYSAAQINSIRGAGMLLPEFHDAIVVDIGGTTTDVGLLLNHSPHMTNLTTQEEGVEFEMDCAHQTMIPVGGGATITRTLKGEVVLHARVLEGQERPLYQGGDVFTLFDLALIQRRFALKGVEPDMLQQAAVSLGYSEKDIRHADKLMHRQVANAIDATRIDNRAMPIVLCGGGAVLLSKKILEKYIRLPYKKILIPEYAEVANAVGASGATIRTQHSVIFVGKGEEEKAEAVLEAKRKAEASGALPASIRVVSSNEQEYSYSLDGQKLYVVVVEGRLASGFIDHMKMKTFSSENLIETVSVDRESLLQDDFYKKQYLTPDPLLVVSCSSVAEKNTKILTATDVEHFAIGAGYLGSGGGGDVKVALQMARGLMRNGIPISMVDDLSKLNDDDYVFCVGYGGMPEIIPEKLTSSLSGSNAITNMKRQLELKLGEEVNAVGVVPIEIGGANGLFAATQAAAAGYPILDMDTMGRAFPRLLMNSANIDGDFDSHLMVLAKEDEDGGHIVVTKKTLAECEMQMYKEVGDNGGAMFIAAMPMTVKQAKAWCMQGTVSAAIKIGERVSYSLQRRLPTAESLNQSLYGTQYKSCRQVFQGTMIEVNRNSDGRHNLGDVVLVDNLGRRRCCIFYKNENLVVTLNGEVAAQMPNIITMVNPDTGLAFGSSSDYHAGLRVAVIEITCPQYFLKTNGDLRDNVVPVLLNEDMREHIAEARRPNIAPGLSLFEEQKEVESESEFVPPIAKNKDDDRRHFEAGLH